MSERLSGRALAAALGVDEKAVRKAVFDTRIERGADGKFDLDGGANRPVALDGAAPHQGPQGCGRSAVRADLSERDALASWCTIAALPTLAAWHVASHGGALQLACDAPADMAPDIAGDLRLRGYAVHPIPFETIAWDDVADEYELAPVDPAAMAADRRRRRDEG